MKLMICFVLLCCSSCAHTTWLDSNCMMGDTQGDKMMAVIEHYKTVNNYDTAWVDGIGLNGRVRAKFK